MNKMCGVLAALVALAFASGAIAGGAEPTCYFMECEGGAPNPTPAAPTPIVAVTPAPQVTDSQVEEFKEAPSAPLRPKRNGETCSSFRGFSYCASSVLAPQFGFNYLPKNLVDNKLDTAWVEGKSGNGEGEWLVVDFGGNRTVKSIELLNGYHKNKGLYERNGRVKDLNVKLSNGYELPFTLEDHGGVQTLTFDEPQEAAWLQLTIGSVYRGTKFTDTAISELRVLTDN